MAIVTVVGAGMMGSALCVPLADRGHDVRLVGTHLDDAIIASYRSTRCHPRMGVPLPESVRVFGVEEIATAMLGVEVIGLGVSSPGVRWAADAIAPFATAAIPVAMITKGLEWNGETLAVLPDVLAAALPPALRSVIAPVAVAGPCIAGELARRVETCVVLTGRDDRVLARVAELLRAPYYHVTTSSDVVGVEACAALKNALAMGIGFGAGIHERAGGVSGSVANHNYEAAVFAEAIREMARVVDLLGGGVESVTGLAGVGDLTVTCNGGRTGRFGRFLGLGLSLPEAIAKMEGATLECMDILRVLASAFPSYEARGSLLASELPLLRHLAAVALDGAPVDMPFQEFFR